METAGKRLANVSLANGVVLEVQSLTSTEMEPFGDFLFFRHLARRF